MLRFQILMIVIIMANDWYKDEPSTVVYLKYNRVARSNCSDSQMPKIDEECTLVSSHTDFKTNEEMLIHVNGGDASKKHHVNLIKVITVTIACPLIEVCPLLQPVTLNNYIQVLVETTFSQV